MTASRASKALDFGLIALVIGVLAFAVLFFVKTMDVMLLVFGIVLALAFFVARWVARDAQDQGLPALPWAIATVLMPGLGLVAYLLLREFRARGV